MVLLGRRVVGEREVFDVLEHRQVLVHQDLAVAERVVLAALVDRQVLVHGVQVVVSEVCSETQTLPPRRGPCGISQGATSS